MLVARIILTAGCLLLPTATAQVTPTALSGVTVAVSAMRHLRPGSRTDCRDDDCIKALLDTDCDDPLDNARRLCSSYLVKTAGPATRTTAATDVSRTTTTTTSTPTTVLTSLTTSTRTIFKGQVLARKRDLKVPDYISAGCTGNVESRFSSACSCLGVTATTVTPTTRYVSTTSVETVTLSRTAGIVTSTTVSTALAIETCPASVQCVVYPFVKKDLNEPCGGTFGTRSCVCNVEYVGFLGFSLVGHCAPCVPTQGLGICASDIDCCSGKCTNYLCKPAT